LNRGWMRSWDNAKSASVCRAVAFVAVPIICATLWSATLALAQNPTSESAAVRHTSTKPLEGTGRNHSNTRNDELTLAGLRPGRDLASKAEQRFSKPASRGDSRNWHDDCRHQTLSIFTDAPETILQVTVASGPVDEKHECAYSGPSRWVTGRGLAIGDSADRVLALYGQPGTRGPSTKAGQQLELFYYAFDWAGPDVPQVMTVLCTPAKEGKPGRVVEITLAAPSL
jgi:hypothetical protein